MTAEPPQASPALAEGLATTTTQIYASAETDLIVAVTTRVRTAITAADPVARMLADSRNVQTDAARIVGRLERESATAVRKALAEAYGRGHGRDRSVADRTSQDVTGRLRTISDAIGAWVRSLWNRLIGVAASESDRDRQKALVGQVLTKAAGRGVTAYAPNGRRTVVSLATEVVQHAAGGAAIDGFTDRLTQDGGDLVIVTESPHPCPICKPWEHKVLSVAGDNEHPSMAEARAAGLFHPHCHHTIAAWTPGFRWPPHSIQHKPGTYDQVQRQRAIEAHIRSWKRRELAAIDDITRAAARRKVRAWEATLRQHIAAHGLQRSRQRERTDYGHTRPLRHAHGR